MGTSRTHPRTFDMWLVLFLALLFPISRAFGSGAPDRDSGLNTFPRLSGSEVVLRYWAPNALAVLGVENYGQIGFYQMMERQTGVRVEFVHPAPGVSAESAFRLAVASKDLPDVIEWDWLRRYDPSGPDKAIADGIIMPLDPLVAGYAPNLRAILAARKDISALVRSPGGYLYAFPSLRVDPVLCFLCGPVARTDWLEKTGLGIPQSMSDWRAMLRAFSRPESLGLSVPASEVKPFALLSDEHTRGQATSATSSFELFRMSNLFAGAFGVGHLFFQKDGRQQFGPALPQYKQMLKELNSWYADGLVCLDLDGAVQRSRIVDYAGTYLKAYEPVPDAGRLTPLPYPTLDGDPSRFVGPALAPPYLGTNSAAISTSNKHPQLSARWLDEGYGRRGAVAYSFGVESQSFIT